ncbi:MAG: leucine-rich repeat domain-containing protein, partial [Kofleriaceae bacterium]
MPADTLDLGAGKQRKSLVALPADLASKHEIKHLVASKCEHLRTLDAASELVSLESIAVDRCPALDLDAAIATLARLPRLVELQLGHRDLSHLPRQLGSLRHVASLTIVDGGRLDFDDAFALLAEMPSLRWLRIVQRKRVALPASIGRLVELRGLLAHGALKQVPDELRRLEKLEQLNLGGARLGEVPDAIFALANLRTLDLSTNELRALPERIAELAQLESLDLRANAIGTVPSAIGRLQALRTLDLSFCEIDRLPDELGDLAQLESLSM